MNLKKNLIRVWKNKKDILSGIKNKIFKKEHVEEIAKYRMDICKECSLYTMDSKGCMVTGAPCCNQLLGGCGCSLELKTRSLSSRCPHPDGPKWVEELTEEEEDLLNQHI